MANDDMIAIPTKVKIVTDVGGLAASRSKAIGTKTLAEQQGPRTGRPKILQYPSDVGEGNSRNVNYILFTAWKQEPAKVKPGFKKAQADAKTNAQMAGLGWFGDSGTVATATSVAQAQQKAGNEFRTAEGLKRAVDTPSDRSLHMTKSYSKSGTTIALYMPPTVQAKYQMKYDDAPIGFMSEAIHGIIKDIQSGTQWSDAINKGAQTAGTGLTKMGIKMLDTIVPGTKDLIAIERGSIIAPRTEVMFQGISKRNFSFNFTFIPKSKPETETIHDIITEFKMAMTPAFKLGVRELHFPEMFEIGYMHAGKENQYINKIGRCYLEDATVSYGGEKFITFDPNDKGAPPNKITLALTFREIEVMDQARIEQGF